MLHVKCTALNETMIVMMSLPFALVGGIWMMWWLGFNASAAIAVGLVALAGVTARTGLIMLINFGQSPSDEKAKFEVESKVFGAVERLRPKIMIVVAIVAGLVPLLWSTGGRLRNLAAHRRTDDWRRGMIDPANAGRNLGGLRAGQGLRIDGRA